MIPDPKKIALAEHQRWLGYLQPEGLVVSALALVDAQVQLDTGSYAATHERFLDATTSDPAGVGCAIQHFPTFARKFLGWQDELLSVFAVSDEVPGTLRVSTGEHGEILEPSAAYRYFKPADPAKPYLLLIKQLPPGLDLDDAPVEKGQRGWIASPHQKFERLLRETGVPIGVLCNGHTIRLVYAPKGENSGWLTFPVNFMAQVAGRAVASALDLLLSHRRLIVVPESVRLPALLRKSRDYQAHVSTELSQQVLHALYELGRGFQSADEKAHGHLLADAWTRNPQEIYGGFITTLLRMVFLFYAEDRGLMPSGELYQKGYSIQGLFEQLRTDHERYPDTMDDRFGGWPRLLTLFRSVYAGCKHPSMHLPARRGHLFDPDRFPFLEGRASNRDPIGETLPRLSDGCLYRVLDLLLYLDGERISYRTLDVEQIGSVYETIMGFHVEKAPGQSIALKPKKAHGAPVHINLAALLELSTSEREKQLKEKADTKLPAAAAKALKEARTIEDLLAALEKRIDRRATPHPVPAGSIILQPTDERRRSGSHYTPRSFTEPIVRKTLEPIFDRLGRHPRPEEILELKLADIAVGSGAFLVESCRQLADELVASWHYHKCMPVIPPDEDEVLVARRVIAQRCLYGVDRNPMAVDLAKLSLWLTTMAKDHPFTFLDHAIKCGDSLVGLTNEQIAAFHWDTSKAKERVFGQDTLERAIQRVSEARKRILEYPEDTEAAILKKREFLASADEAAESIRNTGDLVIAAFFNGDTDKARQKNRDEYLAKRLALEKNVAEVLPWLTQILARLSGGEHPIRPFHWELEFPEVFGRQNPGFDGIVGNPPFAGRSTLSQGSHKEYIQWLLTIHYETHGNGDLVAHFFRRGFGLVRSKGTLGLIATNTISQGDTRQGGLSWILENGGDIYSARRRALWPGDAAVSVSIVHFARDLEVIPKILDGSCAPVITAYLFGKGGNHTPPRLMQNSKTSFQGSVIVGVGFTFDDTDKTGYASPTSAVAELIKRNSRNKDRIFPYLGGEELNDEPALTPTRQIIDFGEMSLAEASAWPELLEIVKNTVKREREEKLKTSRSNDKEKRARLWWQFARTAKELYSAIQPLDSVIALCQTSKYFNFAMVPSHYIFSNKLVVIASSSFASFSCLQCRLHILWAEFMGSTLEDRPVYTPTDCFETFAFPFEWQTNPILGNTGLAYHNHRSDLMLRNNEGLTKTYNRFHDPEEISPDILKLRELHAEMDAAVLKAYGWDDLIPRCQCEFLLDYEEEDEEEGGKARKRKKPWRYRWPDDVRDEVLARLLALNQQRHEEEVRLGIAPGMKKAAKKASKKTGKKGHVSKPDDKQTLLEYE